MLRRCLECVRHESDSDTDLSAADYTGWPKKLALFFVRLNFIRLNFIQY